MAPLFQNHEKDIVKKIEVQSSLKSGVGVETSNSLNNSWHLYNEKNEVY
jgi:hypothetical protein